MFKKVKNYFRNSIQELEKVTWPTKQQAVKLTGIVIVFVIIVAIILGVLDYSFNELYNYLLSLV
jgi:preprotein translocase subunit SecE